MVRFKLVILLTWLVIGQWNVECENEPPTDWSVYERLQSLQFGLLHSKNLDKYVRSSYYLPSEFRAKYNSDQCIKDLKTIQAAFNDSGSNWANECKQ